MSAALVPKTVSFMRRKISAALGLRPSSAPFVSGDGFRALADHVMEENRQLKADKVAHGDIVFVKSSMIPEFFANCLPHIDSPFVLITHNSDFNVEQRHLVQADDERIIRWYALNLVGRHPKVEAIPIGLENLWMHANGEVRDFARLGSALPAKKSRVLYAFSVGTNPRERGPALEALERCPVADGPRWTGSSEYRRKLAQYQFVASPPGNGFDCHRTWEALYLGAIPVARHDPFFDAFPQLPALFVDRWDEVCAWDEVFLRRAYEKLGPEIARCPYMKMEYWAQRIGAAQAAFLHG